MPAAELPRQHPSRLISSSSPKPRQLPAGASLTSRTPCQNPFCVSRHLLFSAWCRPLLWPFLLSSVGMPRTGRGREGAASASPCRELSWPRRLSSRRPVAVGQLRSALFFGDGVVGHQVVDVVVQRRRVLDPPQHRQLRCWIFQRRYEQKFCKAHQFYRNTGGPETRCQHPQALRAGGCRGAQGLRPRQGAQGQARSGRPDRRDQL